MASILTGRFPHETKVINNENNFLNEEVHTVQEVAIENGYKTSFFSGGPPIFRKSGFSQGFELFDDSIRINMKKVYRGSESNFLNFTNWLNQFPNDQAFFSVHFLADLQFPDIATRSNSGEIRSRSYESQLLEINESLYDLFTELKNKKRWDNTNIILVGLTGREEVRRNDEISGLNIYSENTHVPLLIKPARKKRDLGIHWKIDKNVSLVDLGVTLFDLLSGEIPQPPNRSFKVISLKKTLLKPVADWAEDRIIPLESGWHNNRRFAFRMNNYLLVYDNPLAIYNSLIDPNEQTPMSERDPLWGKISSKVSEHISKNDFTPWEVGKIQEIQKFNLGKLIWSNNLSESEEDSLFSFYLNKYPNDFEVAGWLAEKALWRENWVLLQSIGKKFNQSLWSYIAKKKLGKEVGLSSLGCWPLFKSIFYNTFLLFIFR